jgi:hypothetical protein
MLRGRIRHLRNEKIYKLILWNVGL